MHRARRNSCKIHGGDLIQSRLLSLSVSIKNSMHGKANNKRDRVHCQQYSGFPILFAIRIYFPELARADCDDVSEIRSAPNHLGHVFTSAEVRVNRPTLQRKYYHLQRVGSDGIRLPTTCILSQQTGHKNGRSAGLFIKYRVMGPDR